MPTDPPDNYLIDDTNGSGDFNEGDDLKPELKRTLGSFISELTKTQPTKNSYQIEPDVVEPASFQEVTERTPGMISATSTLSDSFIKEVAEDAKAYFESLDQGDYGGGRNPLVDIFDKELRQAKHGEKLAAITGEGQETEIEEKVSEVLKNNRFHPGGNTPYINNRGVSKDQRVQKLFGEYVPEGESGASDYSLEDMQRIAYSLLLKATGRLQSDDNPDEFDSGNILTTTGGEGVQLATVRVGNKKVDTGDMYAANAYQGPNNEKIAKRNAAEYFVNDPELNEKAGPGGFRKPGTSFGQTYSHLEQFAPFGAFSPSPIALLVPQFVTIAASTAAVGVLLQLLVLGFDIGAKDLDPGSNVLPLGKSKESVRDTSPLGFPPSFRSILGIPYLENGPSLIVNVALGLGWFQAASLWGGAGFVTSVQRTVARDVVDFMGMFSDPDGPFSGGLVSDLNGVGIVIDSLLRSPFYRFVVVMMIIGDKILAKKNNKKLDGIDPTILPGFRGAANRISPTEKSLAWASNQPKSVYILPAKIPTSFRAPSQGNDEFVELNDGISRIDAEQVRQIEDNLDAEYMPFYFHDLRTNEIISFNAFLSNISDSYSPTVNSQTGIGRIEPVLIYGGTTRSISLEFVVASLNSADHNSMYTKINKLTTMVYPQFSRGKQLQIESGGKFLQPFSQVQTSSPLIRIRLGDILSSNYTTAAIQRLFGLGDEETFVPPSAGETDLESDANKRSVAQKEKEIEDAKYETPTSPIGSPTGLKIGDEVVFAGLPHIALYRTGANPSAPPERNVPVVPGSAVTVTIGPIVGYEYYKSDPSGESPNDVLLVSSGVIPSSDPEIIFNDPIYSATLSEESHKELQSVVGNDFTVDRTIRVSHGKFRTNGFLDPVYLNNLARRELLQEVEEQAQIFDNEFFSPEKNAIVRSFESTRGRGLAGMITNLDIKWGDTWTLDKGSRAPKYCTITVGFSPVHDITPGIDHNGINRSPIYGVGNTSRLLRGGDPYTGEDES